MSELPVSRLPRTCVGCRQRADRADLVRVVANGQHALPDPDSCKPGRGAWVHPDLDCVALAEQRRAFQRALKVREALDVSSVRTYVVRTFINGNGRKT